MIEKEIHALDRMLDRLDYYRLFKVERRAQLPAIQQAYRDARRRFDPDSFLDAEPEVRAAVDRIARRITEGYLALRDPRRRSAYDAALTSGALRYTSELDEAQGQADEAQGMTANGKRILKALFAEYVSAPELLPERHLRRWAGAGAVAGPPVGPPLPGRSLVPELGRVVGDYLAGMTDRFAHQEYRRLFSPTTDL